MAFEGSGFATKVPNVYGTVMSPPSSGTLAEWVRQWQWPVRVTCRCTVYVLWDADVWVRVSSRGFFWIT